MNEEIEREIDEAASALYKLCEKHNVALIGAIFHDHGDHYRRQVLCVAEGLEIPPEFAVAHAAIFEGVEHAMMVGMSALMSGASRAMAGEDVAAPSE